MVPETLDRDEFKLTVPGGFGSIKGSVEVCERSITPIESHRPLWVTAFFFGLNLRKFSQTPAVICRARVRMQPTCCDGIRQAWARRLG